MAADKLPAPLGGPPPDEVRLENAPLVRVLAQVRFPEQVHIDTKQGIDAFQRAVKEHYPILGRDTTQQVKLDARSGSQTISQQTLFRFLDAEEVWRLTLTHDAVTLETKKYISRVEFLERMGFVVRTVQTCFDPRLAQRVGMRYVDRVTGDDTLEQLERFVRKGVLGIVTSELHDHVRHTISEAALSVEEGEMLLRWGLLPPGGTVDPGVMEPVDKRSWILDIDVSSNERGRSFEQDVLSATFEALAKRAYFVFRYMVQDDFLREFGGKV
ncbi:MAG: TIGR04255 family protein [Parvularcula sp.]|jgi:uncharacterized protein (TIGR04255 family)|nr:TIGR04255 family protein [Parvularcula sp.]